MFDHDDMEKLKEYKKIEEEKRLKGAKAAFACIKYAIDSVEEATYPIKINCHWSGCITIDGQLFLREQLEDK